MQHVSNSYVLSLLLFVSVSTEKSFTHINKFEIGIGSLVLTQKIIRAVFDVNIDQLSLYICRLCLLLHHVLIYLGLLAERNPDVGRESVI